MVMKQVGRMALIGGVIGVIGGLALENTSRSLLFGFAGRDPMVIVFAAVVLTLVALGAGYLPARRASKIHPMQALRYE